MVRSLPSVLDMSRVVRLAALLSLTVVGSSCDSSTMPAGPTPNPRPSQVQAPPPEPAPSPTASPAPAPPRFTYSGIVTDGQGRPVAGVTVRGGPSSATTDANGRYEFASEYDRVPGNLYPPAGYERKPVRWTESFVLTPGQDLTVRRITSLTVTAPTSIPVGERRFVGPRVTFDTGAVETAVLEVFELTSSDASILKAGSGSVEMDRVSLEGVSPGSASVTGRYFGVSSSPKLVQVENSAR